MCLQQCIETKAHDRGTCYLVNEMADSLANLGAVRAVLLDFDAVVALFWV